MREIGADALGRLRKKGVIITTSAASKEELRSGGTLRALQIIDDEVLCPCAMTNG